MREIKFRVWDKNNKKLYYLANNQMSQINLQMNNEFWSLFDAEYRICGKIEKSKIEQYTGLKNKKKKEVWEGDIFKFNHHDKCTLSSFIAVVVYDKENAAFGYKRNGNGWFNQFCEFDELQHDFLNHIDIIGNIHENKILLD